MADLTIIMMTPNLVPQAWAEIHKQKLFEAAGDSDIITVSAKPLNWGTNLIQTEYGLVNLYTQMLRAAEAARTPYIAMADDDTLYPPEHFRFRPPPDVFAYNLTRWHLFSWGPPFFFYKPLPGNGLLIAPRDLTIRGLERRIALGMPDYLCHELGTSRKAREVDGAKWIKFFTIDPVVSFYHEMSVDRAARQRRKKAWPVRALELPYWGRAEHLRRLFV